MSRSRYGGPEDIFGSPLDSSWIARAVIGPAHPVKRGLPHPPLTVGRVLEDAARLTQESQANAGVFRDEADPIDGRYRFEIEEEQ